MCLIISITYILSLKLTIFIYICKYNFNINILPFILMIEIFFYGICISVIYDIVCYNSLYILDYYFD